MKLLLAVSALALGGLPGSAQTSAPPPPSAPVGPVVMQAAKPPGRRATARRPVSPNVARVAAANRAATQEPQAQAFVNAVQVFPFSDGAIYQVYTAPGAVTDIALQAGESLVAVAAGDTVRWVIGDTTSGAGADKRTHILVKPFASGLATNLQLTGISRSRLYELIQSGELETVKVGRSTLIPYKSLKALTGV